MVSVVATRLGAFTVNVTTTGLAEAYQMAAHEIERVQRLPWQELEPCENAPWRFGAGKLAAMSGARGHLTIVPEFEGNPSTKQIIVALEWQHERQGRRTVRLVTLVNRPS